MLETFPVPCISLKEARAMFMLTAFYSYGSSVRGSVCAHAAAGAPSSCLRALVTFFEVSAYIEVAAILSTILLVTNVAAAMVRKRQKVYSCSQCRRTEK